MAFDKETYLKEKAIQFVHEFSDRNNVLGLVGFKTKLRYYLSTLNNDIDKRQFVNYSIDIVYQFPKEEQESLKDFIYVLNGYVSS
jgi:hypothetical protein